MENTYNRAHSGSLDKLEQQATAPDIAEEGRLPEDACQGVPFTVCLRLIGGVRLAWRFLPPSSPDNSISNCRYDTVENRYVFPGGESAYA